MTSGHMGRKLRDICSILYILLIFYSFLRLHIQSKYPVNHFYAGNCLSSPTVVTSGVNRSSFGSVRRHCGPSFQQVFITGCRLFKHSGAAFFIIYLSGDLELNPGPRPTQNQDNYNLPEVTRYENIKELDAISSQRGLKFLHLNARSLLPKIDEIRLLIERYKDIAMISFSETHLTPNVSGSEIAIDGYTIFRKDRVNQAKGGGVIMYVLDSLITTRRPDLESSSVESIWIELSIRKSRSILLGTIYRPPVGSQYLKAGFNSEFEESLDSALAEEKEIILMGDLNANYLSRQKCDGLSKDLKALIKSMGTSQLIKEATRITKNSNTLIDVILSTHPHNIPLQCVIPLGISDHSMIGCVRKTNSLKFKSRTIKCRNYSKYDKETFNNDLKSVSFDTVFSCSNVNNAWSNFKSIFLDICGKHAPLITKKIRGSKCPWLTSEVSKLINTRQYQLRKAKRSGLDEDWSNYRKSRNQVTAAIRSAKASYNRKLIEENLDCPRSFWKTIKKVLPNKSKSNSISQIKVDNNVYTDKLDISNLFCKYFSSVKSRVANEIIRCFSTEQSSTSSYPKDKFQLSAVSNGFVYKYLTQLKASKATGLDCIPARLLKDGAIYITASLTYIINLSISTQQFPQEWKHSKIIPLYKDGSREDMDNYRPISVLPVTSKILEKAVHQQLVDYLEKNTLLSDYQCGFRKKHSTQSAVTFLTDSIRKNMDKSLITGALFIDFRKAFDTIDHVKLLEKLGSFGICDEEYYWMKDYLSNRQQSVSLGDILSDPQPVLSGVPQGSLLGPLLFTLYTTDLPSCIEKANVLMYADDTVIFYGSSNYKDIIAVLNAEISRLADWSSLNELYIHPKKTEYVMFGTAQKLNRIDTADVSSHDVLLGDKVLERKSFYKYLGVYLDEHLSFKEHTLRLFSKVSSQLSLVSRLRNNLTMLAAERIYKAMILPKLDYCDIVWNINLAPTRLKKLERLQIRAAKIVLQESSMSDEQLLSTLRWKTLYSRSVIHRLIFVFKCLKGNNGPAIFSNYFKILNHSQVTRRNGIDLVIPVIRTEAGKKGCFYAGVNDYNSLQSDIKSINSLLIFKSKIGAIFN